MKKQSSETRKAFHMSTLKTECETISHFKSRHLSAYKLTLWNNKWQEKKTKEEAKDIRESSQRHPKIIRKSSGFIMKKQIYINHTPSETPDI